jgi:hypothetical protein
MQINDAGYWLLVAGLKQAWSEEKMKGKRIKSSNILKGDIHFVGLIDKL